MPNIKKQLVMKNAIIAISLFTLLTFFASCGSKSNADKGADTDTVATVQKVTASKYCNEKYGFCISFPENAFKIVEEQDNEEGTVLASEDGLGKIVIHRGNLDQTVKGGVSDLRKAFEADIQPKGKRELTLNTFSQTYYTLMGYEDKVIFYQRTIIVNGEIVTAALYYFDAAKDTYYPMIDSMFKSFK